VSQCGSGPSTARREGPKSRGSGGGEGTEELRCEEEERKGEEGALTGGPGCQREKERGGALGLRTGESWAGRGPRGENGGRGEREMGRGGKRAGSRGRRGGKVGQAGLASLLLFLSLFYFFS
jgi:hypothetical protein